ncbi:MAG: tryptophan 2,3-dioxygenase family protein [Bacteroidetes bacterium]|nr:tryptophan 2,3-dioxygenase family protein [Bacteroidota bacterium]
MSTEPHTDEGFDPAILDKLKQLREKYAAMGQDLSSYLDGLLYADYRTYWDLIHLDTLLSLQRPQTPFHDEVVFIVYHQITELYFKLSLHEFELLADTAREQPEAIDDAFVLERVRRVNRYFEALTTSFDIMVDGMDPKEFMKFRMSLLPASGFQSAQYRMIEICSTTLDRIVHLEQREDVEGYALQQIPDVMSRLYWRAGAVELQSGKKTLTLKQFEKKYDEDLERLAKRMYTLNLRKLTSSLPGGPTSELVNALRWLDINVNVNWPLAHYKSAVRYLHKDPLDIAATGGTNWQKYLPPRFQKRIFFPEHWSDQELAEWGKGWVLKEVFGQSS